MFLKSSFFSLVRVSCTLLLMIITMVYAGGCKKRTPHAPKAELEINIDDTQLHGDALQYPTIGLSGQLMTFSYNDKQNTAVKSVHAMYDNEDYYGLMIYVTVHGVKKPRFCFKNGGKTSQCSTIFRQTFVFGSKTAITRERLLIYPFGKGTAFRISPKANDLVVFARHFGWGTDVRVVAHVDFSITFTSNQNVRYEVNDSTSIPYLPPTLSKGEYHIKAISQ